MEPKTASGLILKSLEVDIRFWQEAHPNECPRCHTLFIHPWQNIYPHFTGACLEKGESMNLNDYSKQSHEDNKKWWHDIKTGELLDRNFGELIALCHSELSEALEGHRKDLQDDKLPHRKMAEVELADCLIRIFDLAGSKGYDLEGAYQEKRLYNAQRADHKHENRVLPGGKKY